MLISMAVSTGHMGTIWEGTVLSTASALRLLGRSEKAGIGPDWPGVAGVPGVVAAGDEDGRTCFMTN